MDATRNERLSINLTPALRERLQKYADQHRWTLSTAVAVLIEQGLKDEPQ